MTAIVLVMALSSQALATLPTSLPRVSALASACSAFSACKVTTPCARLKLSHVELKSASVRGTAMPNPAALSKATLQASTFAGSMAHEN